MNLIHQKMNSTPLYLATSIPQWGIFVSIGLLTIGFVEKKEIWISLGWALLILTGLAALWFNLFGGFNSNATDQKVTQLISTGWQTVAGGVLALITLLLMKLKKKRYPILALLTIVYFVLTFFMYVKLSDRSDKTIKGAPQTEKNQ